MAVSSLRLNVGHAAWDLIWSHVHRVLVVNLGFAVTNLPLLVALAIVHRPWEYPLFFGLLSVSLGPSVAATFGYLDRYDDRSGVRDFARAYLATFRHATVVWSLTLATIAVAAVDIAALRGTTVGAAVIPMLLVLAIVALSTGLAALASAERMALGRLALAASYRVVGRWWVSLANLVLLAVAAVIVNQAPLLGLATVPGIVGFLVWHNTKALVWKIP